MPNLNQVREPSAERLRFLDKTLQANGPASLRLLSNQQEPALLVPLSVLTASPLRAEVKLHVHPGGESDAEVLLLASSHAVSSIPELLEFMRTQVPGRATPSWVGIPEESEHVPATFPEAPLLGSLIGNLLVHDQEGRVTSFALYPLSANQVSSRLQPSLIKVPEPAGNLTARSEWFQRRTGRRKS